MNARRIKSLFAAGALAAALGSAGIALAQEHGGHAPPPTGHGEPHSSGENAHGGEHEEHALKPINWVDFSDKETRPFAALAINFALLMFLYYRFGKTAVANALKTRRETVAKEIEEAAKIKKEAAKRAREYQAKLDKLEEEAEIAKKALIEAGKGERDRIVKDAEEKAERMKRDALFLLEQEIKQMKLDLTRETVELAVAAAEDLLKQKVTQADHDRLAEEFLAQLSGRTPSVAPRAGGPS
jgi:F-type H+-transporting ATPase subunit b